MKKILFLFINLGLVLFAINACCSCSDKKNDATAPVDAATPEEAQAPVMTPFTLTLKGSPVDQGNQVTLEVQYNEDIRVETKLTLEAVNGTFVKNVVKYRSAPVDQSVSSGTKRIVEILSPAERGTKIVRDVVISGEDASVQAVLLLTEDGLSFEMHEVWPDEPLEDLPEISTELDQPFEVEGVVIDRSVNVKPKRPSLPKAGDSAE